MSLEIYNKKRDFSKTPEPKGRKLSGHGHSYVIQKHEASHLHYDFRLEIDGVLKSWAIPKGPSLDPKDKRLAVQTEDHPLDYGDFEGVIPAPGYGAGTVMLWDTGEWQPDGDEREALAKGKINFELKGKRLRGHWSLVKMHGRKTSGKEWLLVKQDDDYADNTVDLADRYQRSVVSRKGMSSIAKTGPTFGKNGDAAAGDVHTAKAEKTKKRTKSNGKAGKQTSNADKIDSTLEQVQKKAPRASGGGSKSNLGSVKEITDQIKNMPDARAARLPDTHTPQLATLYKSVPTSEDWLHEIKYDGYRLLARKQKTVQLLTRNQKDWTRKFTVVAEAMESLPEAILDGELVSLDDAGLSTFEGLQEAISAEETGRLVYYVFDVPFYAGYDLTQVPLRQRKIIAKAAVERIQHPQIRYSEHIEGSGEDVLRHACDHRLEGIISKDANSPYESTRSRSWRKVKCSRRQEFIIIGFTDPGGSRHGFGALLLGYYEGKTLKYAGKVGTGFNADTLTSLRGQLDSLVRKRSPVKDDVDERSVTWVKPELVGEVEFTQWTSANRLRHPVFLGLRADKPAQEIGREVPVDAGSPTAKGKNEHLPSPELNLSNPDKVLYPQQGITKQDLAEYYLMVAEKMLPYVAERPLSLVRCPQGHTRHCFFQKHPGEGFGDAVKTIDIEEKSGVRQYAYIDSANGLLELVQMGTLEIHAWGSRIEQVEKPDTLVFDLDPDDNISWSDLKAAAVELREYLVEIGLVSFLRTTGGKGLHLVVPITPRHEWDEVKAFCRAVAEAMVARHPSMYIATMSKAKRKNKIFIDFFRNSRSATSICSYSTRSRAGAPLAVPLHWDELDQLDSSQAYNVRNIQQRLQQVADPWADYGQTRQSITQRMLNGELP